MRIACLFAAFGLSALATPSAALQLRGQTDVQVSLHSTGCATGQVIYNGACVDKCPSGYSVTDSGNTCQACDVTCNTCLATGTYMYGWNACSSCKGSQALGESNLYGGKMCFDSCANGYYKNGGFCSPCSSACDTCSAENVCTGCKSGKHYFANQCYNTGCPSGSYEYEAYHCASCYNGYDSRYAACATCSDGNAPNQCTSCTTGYAIQNGASKGLCVASTGATTTASPSTSCNAYQFWKMPGQCSSPFVYLDCFADNLIKPDMTLQSGTVSSVYECYSVCFKQEAGFFGIQNGNTCYCGNTFGTNYGRQDRSKCTTTCATNGIDNTKLECGGTLNTSTSVYQISPNAQDVKTSTGCTKYFPTGYTFSTFNGVSKCSKN